MPGLPARPGASSPPPSVRRSGSGGGGDDDDDYVSPRRLGHEHRGGRTGRRRTLHDQGRRPGTIIKPGTYLIFGKSELGKRFIPRGVPRDMYNA